MFIAKQMCKLIEENSSRVEASKGERGGGGGEELYQ